MQARHEKYLLELTGLPTATGREGRVVDWIERWTRRRRSVELHRDRYGNLMLKRVGSRSRKPIVFTAHMDHPAFVVVEQIDSKQVLAEFRGGVQDRYFVGSRVRLRLGGAESRPGRVLRLDAPVKPRLDKRAVIGFARPVTANAGDVITWDLAPPKIVRGLLSAPACDDLAGLAAAIAAFEVLLKAAPRPGAADVRVLLTRAEEVGFIGAIGACKSGIIPKAARLIALETSKSFADSPIGAGPIVRVGDRTASFDPGLTYCVGQVAQRIEQRDPGFNWQRKLMPGGTCEATAYQALGYTATCLCLPLGNYHNMNDGTPMVFAGAKRSGRSKAVARARPCKAKIDAEVISLSDYHALVRLLIEAGKTLDHKAHLPPLRRQLDTLFARRRGLLADTSL